MPLSDYSIVGLVARLVSDEDLIINKGAADGVTVDMIFDVLDPRTQDVRDPVTDEILGSIDRVLARVRVTDVQFRISMAHLVSERGRAFSTTAQIMSGYKGPTRLTSDTWPEGVKQGDPLGSNGEMYPGR